MKYLTILIFTLVMSIHTHAQEVRKTSSNTTISRKGGDGTRGGGETKNGRIRDLVDPTSVDVVSGTTLLNDKSLIIKEVLKPIQNYNYYLYIQLLDEFADMKFMMTRNLKIIDTDDEDSYTYTRETNELVAVRDLLTKVARVDRDKIITLTPQEQSYIYIHETFHSFIDANASLRNEKVRGLGKLIFSIYEGILISNVDFNATISALEVNTVNNSTVNLIARASDREYCLSKEEREKIKNMFAKDLAEHLSRLSGNRQKQFAHNTGIHKQIGFKYSPTERDRRSFLGEKEIQFINLKGVDYAKIAECFILFNDSLTTEITAADEGWLVQKITAVFYNPFTKERKKVTFPLYFYPSGVTIQNMLTLNLTWGELDRYYDRTVQTQVSGIIFNLILKGFCDRP